MNDLPESPERIAELRMAREAIDLELARLGVDPAPEPEWVPLSVAAHRCRRHPDRMAQLVRLHGLGRRIGRDWFVDWRRVSAWLQGAPYSPIRDQNVWNRGIS